MHQSIGNLLFSAAAEFGTQIIHTVIILIQESHSGPNPDPSKVTVGFVMVFSGKRSSPY